MSKLPAAIQNLVDETKSNQKHFAIVTAALAYATGDAFGVAYEFEPRVKAPIPRVMLGKTDWPAGGVSDDTLLSLMTISCLDAKTPEEGKQLFIEKLRAAAKNLRGLGPTTRHALGIFVEPREVGIIGTTNGGMMRTALLSLAFKDQTQRQTWVRELCSATHAREQSLFAALLMAEIFNGKTLEQAIREIQPPFQIDIENFKLPSEGISLNPIESLLAINQIANDSETVWQAYEQAICAGGDTDTIAALSSALVALKNPASYYELDFIGDVNWAEIPELPTRIRQLIESNS